MAEAVAERAVQVRPVVQGVHLVDAHAVEPVGAGLDRVEQRDRFAVGERHDEVGAGSDVVEQPTRACGGDRGHGSNVRQAGQSATRTATAGRIFEVSRGLMLGPFASVGLERRSVPSLEWISTCLKRWRPMLGMVRSFMDAEVVPLEGEMLHGDASALDAGVARAQRKVREMGLWAPNHPVEFGGLGLSMVDHGLLSEVLGRSPLGHVVFGVQAPDAGNIEILHARRDGRTARALPSTARRGQDPQLLLDDRARDAGFESNDDVHDGRQGRR